MEVREKEKQQNRMRLDKFRKFRKWLMNKEYKTIQVELPRGFMNCGITVNNNFIADTNNNSNWDTLRFPLPKPKHKWHINYYTSESNKINKKIVVLIDRP